MDISKEEKAKREKFIIDEGGIWPVYEAFYLEAIIYSAGRAQDAFNRFDYAVAHSGIKQQ